MRFYKILDRRHPTHTLPTVQWDKRTDSPLFEFTKTDVAGVLGCDVEDPEIIDMLLSAGYVTDKPQGPNIPGMAMMHPVGPGDPGYEDVKAAEARAARRVK